MQAESIRNVQAFYSYNDIERDLWEARLYASQQKFFYTLSIIGCHVLLVGSIFTFIRYRQERKNALRRLKDNEKQILKKEQEIKDLSSVKNSLLHDIQEHKIKEQQQEKLSHIKESLERDISILKTENSNLRNQEETRKEKLAQLQVGRLYDKFRSPISWTPTNDDWNKLFVTVEQDLGAQLCDRFTRVCSLERIREKDLLSDQNRGKAGSDRDPTQFGKRLHLSKKII